MHLKFKLTLALIIGLITARAQIYNVATLIDNTKNTSIRGLSVVNDDIIWTSGSNGYIGKSTDGGKTWKWVQPKGYEKCDFRDIEAFDHLKAIVINAGSPAYVLYTIDGGNSWREVYKNMDSDIFLDGMAFWDMQHGIIFGDPIRNRMQLLRTRDGGLTWQNISDNLKPDLAMGEAGFAASGTSIVVKKTGKVWIATGGSTSKIYFSANYGENWKVFKCPILQGESSTGVFSMSMFDHRKGLVVGGNYLKDKDNTNNVLITRNGGKSWRKPKTQVSGYRSGVDYLTDKLCIATGTSGTDISSDGGKNWNKISDLSFNAVQKAKNGSLVVLAGNKGQVFKLVYVKNDLNK